ncbi:hypothetical protein ACFWNT_46245 [Streptomyces sp. NPDC058409]|uniref:hypothetical protein n=1 Tax=Streptomyces sp. NPDC058409 TaxID=3346484 RepID=UPI00364C4A2A
MAAGTPEQAHVSATQSGGSPSADTPVSHVQPVTPSTEDDEADASVVQNVDTNNGTVIGVQNVSEIQRLRGTPLPKDWIDEQLNTYVADSEATEVLDALLTNHRVAVLHAGPGTGRYTTALHVLARKGVPSIRQVRREPNEPFDIEGLKDEGTGWILDLRDPEERVRPGFGLHLEEGTDHLLETRSFLVVVIRTQAWSKVADEASRLAYPLAPPSALAVLSAHLTRGHASETAERWLKSSEIADGVKDSTPANAARWARIIGSTARLNPQAASPNASDKDFLPLVDFVVQSAQNWRETLRDWHSDNTVSTHRDYLLAAATLDGAPAETIYEAQATLSRALKDKSRPTKGQQGPGIIELTHTIKADLGSDDRIRFLRPGYAEAVVDYFWVDRPHHVAAFTRWTAEQATALPADIGLPLAERVTQWATRYTLAKQNVRLLRTITSQWAGSKRMSRHAQDLLVAAALDPTTGKLARDHYLAWAKAPDTNDPTHTTHTPVALKGALAGALAELGSVYPRIALNRLSALAEHSDDPHVTEAVGDALTSLWDQPRLQSTIRTTLTSWFNSSQHHYTSAARRTFLHLATRTTSDEIPILLNTANETADPWALNGWRCALDGNLSPDLQSAFSTWMNTILSHPDTHAVVLTTFTEAIFRSDPDRTFLAPRFLLLSHTTNRWEPAHANQLPSARTRLRDELLMALHAADPAAPTPTTHATNTP